MIPRGYPPTTPHKPERWSTHCPCCDEQLRVDENGTVAACKKCGGKG